VEFHVHKNASLLAMGAMMFQNLTGKSDQPMVYVSKLLNKTKQNYSTNRERLKQWFLFCTSSNIIFQRK
jgi:hypothetical protein